MTPQQFEGRDFMPADKTYVKVTLTIFIGSFQYYLNLLKTSTYVLVDYYK